MELIILFDPAAYKIDEAAGDQDAAILFTRKLLKDFSVHIWSSQTDHEHSKWQNLIGAEYTLKALSINNGRKTSDYMLCKELVTNDYCIVLLVNGHIPNTITHDVNGRIMTANLIACCTQQCALGSPENFLAELAEFKRDKSGRLSLEKFAWKLRNSCSPALYVRSTLFGDYSRPRQADKRNQFKPRIQERRESQSRETAEESKQTRSLEDDDVTCKYERNSIPPSILHQQRRETESKSILLQQQPPPPLLSHRARSRESESSGSGGEDSVVRNVKPRLGWHSTDNCLQNQAEAIDNDDNGDVKHLLQILQKDLASLTDRYNKDIPEIDADANTCATKLKKLQREKFDLEDRIIELEKTVLVLGEKFSSHDQWLADDLNHIKEIKQAIGCQYSDTGRENDLKAARIPEVWNVKEWDEVSLDELL